MAQGNEQSRAIRRSIASNKMAIEADPVLVRLMMMIIMMIMAVKMVVMMLLATRTIMLVVMLMTTMRTTKLMTMVTIMVIIMMMMMLMVAHSILPFGVVSHRHAAANPNTRCKRRCTCCFCTQS